MYSNLHVQVQVSRLPVLVHVYTYMYYLYPYLYRVPCTRTMYRWDSCTVPLTCTVHIVASRSCCTCRTRLCGTCTAVYPYSCGTCNPTCVYLVSSQPLSTSLNSQEHAPFQSIQLQIPGHHFCTDRVVNVFVFDKRLNRRGFPHH